MSNKPVVILNVGGAVLPQAAVGRYKGLLLDFWSTWSLRQMEGAGQLDPTPDTTRRLQRVRLAFRDRHRVATTLGFGPRYLHSTGQLHKGGPASGVFIQVVDDGRDTDLPIPGRPFTFGRLLDAQALADLCLLRRRGRRVARVTLPALEAATT